MLDTTRSLESSLEPQIKKYPHQFPWHFTAGLHDARASLGVAVQPATAAAPPTTATAAATGAAATSPRRCRSNDAPL
eukprot:3672101-Pyramimonas_sp.AAC.1